MQSQVRKYLSKIGRAGGRKSRRTLTPDRAREMVLVREARRAYRRFHSRCFWSHDPAYRVTIDDLPWVRQQLMKHGGREGWNLGAKLCR